MFCIDDELHNLEAFRAKGIDFDSCWSVSLILADGCKIVHFRQWCEGCGGVGVGATALHTLRSACSSWPRDLTSLDLVM